MLQFLDHAGRWCSLEPVHIHRVEAPAGPWAVSGMLWQVCVGCPHFLLQPGPKVSRRRVAVGSQLPGAQGSQVLPGRWEQRLRGHFRKGGVLQSGGCGRYFLEEAEVVKCPTGPLFQRACHQDRPHSFPTSGTLLQAPWAGTYLRPAEWPAWVQRAVQASRPLPGIAELDTLSAVLGLRSVPLGASITAAQP